MRQSDPAVGEYETVPVTIWEPRRNLAPASPRVEFRPAESEMATPMLGESEPDSRPEDLPPTRIKPAFYENTGFMRSAPRWTRSRWSLEGSARGEGSHLQIQELTKGGGCEKR